jgi:phosphopantetheinyl transferase
MINFLELYAGEFGYTYGMRKIMDRPSLQPSQGKAEDYFREAPSYLSDAETTEYLNIRSEKRRNEWLAGRLAAKDAFYQFHGCAYASAEDYYRIEKYQQISVLSYPSRAPYFSEYPHLNLSISHSQDYCIAVISTSTIGIDLEWIEPRPTSLVRRFFCQAEWDLLEEFCQSSVDLDTQITRLWTRKEAAAKFLQLGGSLDFRLLDTSEDIIALDHVFDQAIRLISGRWNGYWISLAVETEMVPIY